MIRIRFLALVPAVLSAIAFILQLVSLLSGEDRFQTMNLVTLNTSHVGEKVITFSPANQTFNRTTPPGTSTKSAVLAQKTTNPRDIFSDGASFFSAGAASATSVLAGAPTVVGSALAAGASNAANIIEDGAASIISGDANSLLNAILPAGFPLPSDGLSTTDYIIEVAEFILTKALGSLISPDALTADEAYIVSELMTYIGVQDYYIMHMMTWCVGNYTGDPNANSVADNSTLASILGAQAATNTSNSDPRGNGSMVCSTYSSSFNRALGGPSNTTSSVQILNVNATVPLLANGGGTLNSINTILQTLAVVIKILHVVNLVSTAITALLSLAAFVFPTDRVIKIIRNVSLISMVTQVITTLVFGLIVVLITSIINNIGDDLDIYVQQGGFMKLTTVSFLFVIFTATFWTLIWLVETRVTGLNRRFRTPSERGNWFGIISELRRDFRRPKKVDGKGGGEDTLMVGAVASGVDEKGTYGGNMPAYLRAANDRPSSVFSDHKDMATIAVSRIPAAEQARRDGILAKARRDQETRALEQEVPTQFIGVQAPAPARYSGESQIPAQFVGGSQVSAQSGAATQIPAQFGGGTQLPVQFLPQQLPQPQSQYTREPAPSQENPFNDPVPIPAPLRQTYMTNGSHYSQSSEENERAYRELLNRTLENPFSDPEYGTGRGGEGTLERRFDEGYIPQAKKSMFLRFLDPSWVGGQGAPPPPPMN